MVEWISVKNSYYGKQYYDYEYKFSCNVLVSFWEILWALFSDRVISQ